ncbi:olfactory receptor 11A1-like [Periophthalmus magnuspinnatus]|uniref:olfactory receptor 11A1-like n=1 Tax=Periophthalmus magnuspinnatus TaxID=409849 RepID=UPI00145A702A|nr:olfactory receptor 11A1-like [Periophthalmus magnuspinnatus]
MGNSSQVSHFTLGAYYETGLLRWLYFLIILSVYILIVLSNLLLIVVICSNRTLHEPMYLFLCSLFVNELYGSTTLFPFLLVQILSDSHLIPIPFCFLQIFCMYHYASAEFFMLAAMSYDRYMAICFPLQYNTKMNVTKVSLLIFLSWFVAFVGIAVMTSLSVPLKLCGTIIDRIICGNYSIVKLACFNTKANNIFGLLYTLLSVVPTLSLILFTYVRILQVCFSGSMDMRHKALGTCAPHLLSVLNFSFGCSFQIVQSRFDMNSINRVVGILLTLYFLTVQPLFSPVVYGLKMSKIKDLCKRLLCGK